MATTEEFPTLNDVVALLADEPEAKLVRGQVGTVLDALDGTSALVEFTDDEGKTFAQTFVEAKNLLVLHFEAVVAR